MASTMDIDKIDVGVYDKVREYLKADRYLGGLIKVYRVVHTYRIGRTIQIIVPCLDEFDVIEINGVEYEPIPSKAKQKDSHPNQTN